MACVPASLLVSARRDIGVETSGEEGQTYLELGHALPVLHPDLAHVQHPIVKHPHKRHPIRPLLGALPEHEQARVVLVRPELERGGVLERPDGVFLREGDRVGALQCHLRPYAGATRSEDSLREWAEERRTI